MTHCARLRETRLGYDLRAMPFRTVQPQRGGSRTILIDSLPPTEQTTPTLFRRPVVPTFIPDTPTITQGVRVLPRPAVTLNLS